LGQPRHRLLSKQRLHRLDPRKVKQMPPCSVASKQCLNGSLPLREHLFRLWKAKDKLAGVVKRLQATRAPFYRLIEFSRPRHRPLNSNAKKSD
jgi:hypothetical protein